MPLSHYQVIPEGVPDFFAYRVLKIRYKPMSVAFFSTSTSTTAPSLSSWRHIPSVDFILFSDLSTPSTISNHFATSDKQKTEVK